MQVGVADTGALLGAWSLCPHNSFQVIQAARRERQGDLWRRFSPLQSRESCSESIAVLQVGFSSISGHPVPVRVVGLSHGQCWLRTGFTLLSRKAAFECSSLTFGFFFKLLIKGSFGCPVAKLGGGECCPGCRVFSQTIVVWGLLGFACCFPYPLNLADWI